MTVTGVVIKNMIRKLITGQDYRSEIVTLLDAEFLQYVVDFFKRVACAKLDNKDVTVDWYKKEFLCSDSFSPQEIAIHSGPNKKTITGRF
ncbi:CfrBI family restriction endonuclease [Candidatus Poribacteria bacterium]|nr:CfrBI family restriction endonuclease [Candidatus Poribacteria bacterium]